MQGAGAEEQETQGAFVLAFSSECAVCLSAPRTVRLSPCGHTCLCQVSCPCSRSLLSMPRTVASVALWSRMLWQISGVCLIRMPYMHGEYVCCICIRASHRASVALRSRMPRERERKRESGKEW
jgi:hypothetical protein